jgi:integrase
MTTTKNRTTEERVEPGIFKRRSHRTGLLLPHLWISYPKPGGGTVRESTGSASLVAARKLRAKRLDEVGRGLAVHASTRTTVNDVLDAFEQEAIRQGRDLPTLRSHLNALRPALGTLRVPDVTTKVIEACHTRWQDKDHRSAARCNRLTNTLRAAFRFGMRTTPPLTFNVPYMPRLIEPDHRGRRYTAADRTALLATLPAYIARFFRIAVSVGVRKGQLARTLRRYVDLDRGAIEWPPAECKAKRAHTLPLDGEVLAIVTDLMRRPPLHCPYLFHGPSCAPGSSPSQRYGCLRDFKRAWKTALKAAGLPIGRSTGGFTFHHTRNTAATDLRAGGMDEADVMRVGGWKSRHVFDHYDLGDVNSLRERLTTARAKVAKLTGVVTRRQCVAQGDTARNCTTTAQRAES